MVKTYKPVNESDLEKPCSQGFLLYQKLQSKSNQFKR